MYGEFDLYKTDCDDLVDELQVEFSISLSKAMQDLNITRNDLAEKVSVSPAYISRILKGNVKLSVELMAKIAMAVGYHIKIDMVPEYGSRTDG